MNSEKKVLIVTDSDASLDLTAQSIKSCLKDYDVKICPAADFAGTDLLPSQIFFIGCGSPKPPSFSYLEEMLSHINFASRKCGVFSVNQKSLKYLGDILKDSEAALGETMLSTDGGYQQSDINKWVKGLLK